MDSRPACFNLKGQLHIILVARLSGGGEKGGLPVDFWFVGRKKPNKGRLIQDVQLGEAWELISLRY